MSLLQRDWVEVTSPASGRRFLWNARTNERRVVAQASPQPVPQPTRSPSAVEESDWALAYAPDGIPYYFNRSTREVRWSAQDAAHGVQAPPPPQLRAQSRSPTIQSPRRSLSPSPLKAASPARSEWSLTPIEPSSPAAVPAFAAGMQSIAKIDAEIADLGGRIASLQKVKAALLAAQRRHLELVQANVNNMLGTVAQMESPSSSPRVSSAAAASGSLVLAPGTAAATRAAAASAELPLPPAAPKVTPPSPPQDPPPPTPPAVVPPITSPATMGALVDILARCSASSGSRRSAYDALCSMISVVDGAPNDITRSAFAAVCIRFISARIASAAARTPDLIAALDIVWNAVAESTATPDATGISVAALGCALCALFELSVSEAAEALFCASDDLMGDGCLGKPELTHAFAAVLAAAKVLGHGQPMTHPRETALHLATELIRSGGRGAKLSKAEFIPLYREMVAGG